MLNKTRELNREYIRVRYNGPAVEDHYIDAADLGSSLIALSTLCGIASKHANGDDISTKSMVSANLNQKCFELDFCLYCVSIYAHIKTILGSDDIATAKELFRYLGLLTGAPDKILGLFQAAARIGGRKIINVEQNKGFNTTNIIAEGDRSPITVDNRTFVIMQEPSAVQNMHCVTRPVAAGGYEDVEFEARSGDRVKITQEDASEILNYSSPYEAVEPQLNIAWLQIYSPVYKKDAKRWQFLYGDNHIFVDISETNIAQDAMEKGGTSVGDTYKVELEITQKLTPSGNYSNHYKILKVLGFRAGPEQFTITPD